MSEWKEIEGYEGFYEVSDAGQVRRVGKATGAVQGRIRKTHISNSGYESVGLSKENVVTTLRVHRLVAKAFLPNRKEQVNHINGDKTDNRVENLEWATQSENMRHAVATGLCKGYAMSGENNPFSKLSDRDRRTIGLMRYMKVPQRVIAEMFSVCIPTVQKQPKVQLVC